MKRKLNCKLALLISIIAIVILSGCASTRIKHVSAEEFIKHAKMIEQMNSAMWMSCLGTSQGRRAYFEFQDMLTLSGKPKTIVYWTELDELPKELADKLKSGNPPWTPWWLKIKKN